MPANGPPRACVLTVAAIKLFRRAPEEICAGVANVLRLRNFAPGEPILGRGEATEKVCFVLSGLVRVSHVARTGREVVLVERRAGELVGLFEQGNAGITNLRIAAIEPSCIGFMGCAELWRILARNPELLGRLFSHGVDLVRDLSERLVQLATLKVRQRICAELLRLARGAGSSSAPLVVSPAPRHAELANRVHTHREAVTRELGRLEQAGLIRRTNGTLLILDPQSMREAIHHVP